MAAAMSTITVAADVWTAVYTAAGTVTIGLCNRMGHNMLIRVDATAATTDAATAAADVLHPGDYRTYPLISGDKVIARPDVSMPSGIALQLTLRTP